MLFSLKSVNSRKCFLSKPLKVIATRIKNVLPNVIHCNQSGYVKDRYIGETVRSIFDIMDFTDRENIPGLLIFIDFQKAFDTVELGLPL